MNGLWEKLDPGFFAPIWLAVGLVAVIAVILLEIGALRRRRQALRMFAASHLITALTAVSPLKRTLKRVLLTSAVALLFIAMARPHLLYDWRDETRTGLDALFAVDCSKSMLTEDVKPNRLERAKLAIADFGDKLPDNRLGLIAFAGDAFLQCPLTLDHDAFQAAVRELDTDTIPRPGTDIATAIEQAELALKSQSGNMKFLILVTDGEDLEGRVLDAAKSAAQAGLKIYTVGVGTANGGMIPEVIDGADASSPSGVYYHRDSNGQEVVSKLDENTLRQIASITGGAYVPLGQNGEGLQEIYDRYIASVPRQQLEERREKIQIERFEWPLGLAILFLIWEFIVTERSGSPQVPDITPPRRIPNRRPAQAPLTATVPLLLALLVLGGIARGANTDTAERDYKSGKYEDAMENYRQATENQPDRSDLQYNLGDAAYKAGEYNEAEEAFRKTLETPDLNLQEKTYYNLGNTQFRHGEAVQKVDTKKTIGLWEEALHSYDSALKLKPSADAKHNYEIVKEKLEQLKQQQQQQDKNKNQQQNQDNQNGQSGQNSQQQQDKQQQQGQQQNNQNQNQNQQQQGNEQAGQDKDKQSGSPQDKDKQQQQTAGNDNNPNNTQQRAYSGSREQDKQDPGVKSRQEAEDLLDSLKDDEKHVSARTLLGNDQPPPPPPSGKDW
ncbi:MAG: VWA domain-containing protein [Methylacidiphilales bacterium]|nr:VWA domain-containing protein [Candidatus Methylacidiphilales bacterium]